MLKLLPKLSQPERYDIKWEPPPKGWVKLNINGARDIVGNAWCGCIIRGDKESGSEVS